MEFASFSVGNFALDFPKLFLPGCFPVFVSQGSIPDRPWIDPRSSVLSGVTYSFMFVVACVFGCYMLLRSRVSVFNLCFDVRICLSSVDLLIRCCRCLLICVFCLFCHLKREALCFLPSSIVFLTEFVSVCYPFVFAIVSFMCCT